MPTPVKNMEKMPTVRRKAINYRGTPVIKDLASTLKGRNFTKQNQGSWYCCGCDEDKMADMRQCSKCGNWYLEECVGLPADDIGSFKCPGGC